MVLKLFQRRKSRMGQSYLVPEKHQIIVETGIVFFVVIAFTVAVYLMDIIFKGLLGLIPLR